MAGGGGPTGTPGTGSPAAFATAAGGGATAPVMGAGTGKAPDGAGAPAPTFPRRAFRSIFGFFSSAIRCVGVNLDGVRRRCQRDGPFPMGWTSHGVAAWPVDPASLTGCLAGSHTLPYNRIQQKKVR